MERKNWSFQKKARRIRRKREMSREEKEISEKIRNRGMS